METESIKVKKYTEKQLTDAIKKLYPQCKVKKVVGMFFPNRLEPPVEDFPNIPGQVEALRLDVIHEETEETFNYDISINCIETFLKPDINI